ncbi:hypothetical protein DFJ77DRAFT_211740 [Powellomyces hirtus]|nr:hypothetical protein DFJ77DRAFT_211740 [Powellomyces hirtus]
MRNHLQIFVLLANVLGVAIADKRCPGDSRTGWVLIPGNFPDSKIDQREKLPDSRAPAKTDFAPNEPLLYQDINVPWENRTLPLDFDVDGANPLRNISLIDQCVQECQKRGADVCTAVNYRVSDQSCFLKKIDAVPNVYIGVKTGVQYREQESSSSSIVWKVGLGIGLAIVAVLLGCGVGFWLYRRRRSKDDLPSHLTPGQASGYFSHRHSMTSSTPPGSASQMKQHSRPFSHVSSFQDSPSSESVTSGSTEAETYAQYMQNLRPAAAQRNSSRNSCAVPPSTPTSPHLLRPMSATHDIEHRYSQQQFPPTKAMEAAAASATAAAASTSQSSISRTQSPPEYMTLPPENRRVSAYTNVSNESTTAASTTAATTGAYSIPSSPTESTVTSNHTNLPWVDAQGVPLERDEFFMDRVHMVKRMYSPKAPDEIQVRLGDSVVLQKIWGDGWATGINTTTGHQGVLPLAALGLQPDGTQAPASAQAQTGEISSHETVKRALNHKTA